MSSTIPLAIALTVVSGIWVLVLTLRLPILHAGLGTIVTASCFGAAFMHWDMGAATLSADRLAIAAVAALAIAKRLLTRQLVVRFDPGDWVLAAFLAYVLISVWLHPWTRLWDDDMPPWFRFLNSLAAPAIVFWIIRHSLWEPGNTRRVCLFCVLFGLYLAVMAVAQVHGFSTIVFPRHILDGETLYPGRASGPFVSAPMLGTWITIATVAALLLLRQPGGVARMLLWLILPLFCYAEYLSKTRSAWLGFALATTVALFSTMRVPKTAMLAGLLAAVLLAGVFLGEEFVLPSRPEGRSVVARSIQQRLDLAKRAGVLFLRNPILGCGFGQFEHASRTLTEGAGQGLSSHNVLLRILAETGLAGTALFVLLYAGWLVRARQTLVSAPADSPTYLLAVLFLGALLAYWSEAMFHDVTHMMIGNLTIFFLAGCLCAATRATQPAPVAVSTCHSLQQCSEFPGQALGGPAVS